MNRSCLLRDRPRHVVAASVFFHVLVPRSFSMTALILWAALALAPVATAADVGCGACACCGCCESGVCLCKDCTCCCCEADECCHLGSVCGTDCCQ